MNKLLLTITCFMLVLVVALASKLSKNDNLASCDLDRENRCAVLCYGKGGCKKCQMSSDRECIGPWLYERGCYGCKHTYATCGDGTMMAKEPFGKWGPVYKKVSCSEDRLERCEAICSDNGGCGSCRMSRDVECVDEDAGGCFGCKITYATCKDSTVKKEKFECEP